MSSSQKLKEAEFFLELLDALDQRKRALTRSADTALEASYLFSAILNAFYSAIAIMRDEEHIDVQEFIDAHPEVYARAKHDGERARTVHVSHTVPSVSGYIPPRGNEVNLDLRKDPVLIDEARTPGRADLALGPNHYMYISLQGQNVEVSQFCYRHFHELLEFHAATRNET